MTSFLFKERSLWTLIDLTSKSSIASMSLFAYQSWLFALLLFLFTCSNRVNSMQPTIKFDFIKTVSIRFYSLMTSTRIMKDDTIITNLSKKLNMSGPWNAPRFVWSFAWKLQTFILPLLHYFDKCASTDSFVNLPVLWWKAIASNNIFSRLYDQKVTYDLLPSITRLIVSFPFCLLYPKLHHQNIAMRTLYLDQMIDHLLLVNTSSSPSSSPAVTSVPVTIINLGSGFDPRALRYALLPLSNTLKNNIKAWIELDLPSVIQQKRSILERFLTRRPTFPRSLLPTLVETDLNDVTKTVQQLDTALSSIHKRLPFFNTPTQQERQCGRIILVTEASLFYTNQSTVPALLQQCIHTASLYSHDVKYCFVDRLPIEEANKRRLTTSAGPTGSTGAVTTASPASGVIDTHVEHKQAEAFLSSIGLRLEQWEIKPGIARHMGYATYIKR